MKKYVCGITFQHELGFTDEISVYDSLEELKEKHPCYEDCGIVEIETEGVSEKYTLHEWVVEQDLKWGNRMDYVDPVKEDKDGK